MPARYYRELLKFCLRAARDRDLAADTAQESYARMLAVSHAVDQPRAFLRQIARNVLRDHWRTEKLQHAIFSRADLHEGAETKPAADEPAAPACWQPEEQADARQRLARLQRAIDSLPPRQREVFMLYRFEELPQQDIARRLGISVRMVERHLQLAMLHCKRQVQDSFPTTSSEA